MLRGGWEASVLPRKDSLSFSTSSKSESGYVPSFQHVATRSVAICYVSSHLL